MILTRVLFCLGFLICTFSQIDAQNNQPHIEENSPTLVGNLLRFRSNFNRKLGHGADVAINGGKQFVKDRVNGFRNRVHNFGRFLDSIRPGIIIPKRNYTNVNGAVTTSTPPATNSASSPMTNTVAVNNSTSNPPASTKCNISPSINDGKQLCFSIPDGCIDITLELN